MITVFGKPTFPQAPPPARGPPQTQLALGPGGRQAEEVAQESLDVVGPLNHLSLYRESIEDPWEWLFFQQVVGKNVGMYMARSPDHTWADFDEYMGSEIAQLAGTHFDATVQPLVDEVWNLIDQDEGELSRLPEDIEPYTLFNVSVFYLKPDQMMAFSEAVGKMKQVVVDHDFPFYWGAQVQVAGTEGPTMALVGWAESWADMAEDPAMEAAVVEAYGEDGAEELFQQFYGSFHHFENFIGMKRPDLSSGGGM